MNEPNPRVHIPLSSSHAGTLIAHLKTFEEFCREIEMALQKFHGIYYYSTGTIPEDRRHKMSTILAAVFECLEVIRRDLGLEKQEINRLDYINAYLNEAWVTVSETRSESLKAYGPLPEGLANYLDPRLEEIELLLKQFTSLVDRLKAEENKSRSVDSPR